MRFYSTTAFVLAPFLATTLAVPFGDTTSNTSPNLNLDLDLESRSHNSFNPRRQSPAASSCTPQNPIASNVCSSGSPYCCSGSGKSTVCGPASTTKCESTTICCINTNGMQICAGEVDFTGPVTINNNVNLVNLNLCLRDEY